MVKTNTWLRCAKTPKTRKNIHYTKQLGIEEIRSQVLLQSQHLPVCLRLLYVSVSIREVGYIVSVTSFQYMNVVFPHSL